MKRRPPTEDVVESGEHLPLAVADSSGPSNDPAVPHRRECAAPLYDVSPTENAVRFQCMSCCRCTWHHPDHPAARKYNVTKIDRRRRTRRGGNTRRRGLAA